MRELEAFFEQMDREWYSDDPEWQKSHQDADSARAEQRAAKDYREQQEKAQQAKDLSTQAAMEEKLTIRDYQKRLETLYSGEYTDRGKIYVQQELKLSDSAVIAPVKDYYNSIEKTGPFEFQIVVDSRQEMAVHTIRHLGKMAIDLAEMVTMVTGAVASASTTPATGIAGAYYAFQFLGGFAMAGVSLVSEIGETINDIAAFNRDGCVISTVSPLSDPGEYIMWIALGVGD